RRARDLPPAAATASAEGARGARQGRRPGRSPPRGPASRSGVSGYDRLMNETPAQLAARYEVIALCLQGGGALGAYQAGVYQALDEAGILPTWVSGISIGSINAALIAGNPPERRVARLREFWESVSRDALPFEAPDL